MKLKSLMALAPLVLGSTLIGCEREGVRVYSVPKETPRLAAGHGPGDGHDHGPAPAGAPADAAHGAAPGADAAPQWVLPDGWELDPTPRQMRYATLRAGTAENAVEVAVSRFPGDAGGLDANVNRWREQMGAGSLAGSALRESLRSLSGGKAHVVDVTAPQGGSRLLAAIIFQPREAWFVKLVASDAAVTLAAPAFERFVESLRFEGDHHD